MSNKQFFVFVMFWVISIIFMLMLFTFQGRPACIKINNEVFFVETLQIYSNGAISYKMDGERIYSNNATYFLVENEKDCEIIREILK